MKKDLKFLPIILCGFLFSSTFAQNAPATSTDDLAMLKKHEFDYIYTSYVDARIRQLALSDRKKLEEKLLLKPKEWQNTFSDFSPEQFRDFFVGTVLLRGSINSSSNSSSVTGFYNPWWDTILLVESVAVREKINEQDAEIRKVRKISLLTGATLRKEGETAAQNMIQYFMKPNQYVSYKVSELFSRTRKVFDEYYKKNETIRSNHILRDSRKKKEDQLINAFSYVRLKQANQLISNKSAHDEAWRIASALQTGTVKIFDLMFSSEYAKMMNRAFVELPPEVRKGFQPYGYYPAIEKGSKVRCYIYINTKFPRLFAVTYLGLGYRKTVFEWFDFAQADKIVQQFQKAEKAKKDGAK